MNKNIVSREGNWHIFKTDLYKSRILHGQGKIVWEACKQGVKSVQKKACGMGRRGERRRGNERGGGRERGERRGKESGGGKREEEREREGKGGSGVAWGNARECLGNVCSWWCHLALALMVDGSRHCFLPRCIQCHYSWCQCRCLKLRGRNEGKINDSLCMFLSSLHSPTSMYSLAMEGSELRNCHWDLQTTVCLPNFLKLHSELLCVLECTESIRNCGREIELSNFFLHFR